MSLSQKDNIYLFKFILVIFAYREVHFACRIIYIGKNSDLLMSLKSPPSFVLTKIIILVVILEAVLSLNAKADLQMCQKIYTPIQKTSTFDNLITADILTKKVENQELKNNLVGTFQSQAYYRKYFSTIMAALKDRAPEILDILLEFNNQAGNRLEWAQTIKLLTGIESYDLYRLTKIKKISNAAIMGSTNVPLYTLIAHGLVSSSFSEHVWFRTPEKTRQIYIKILEQLKLSLPAGFLSNFHLITDDKDVSYDIFNRVFVMGLNRNGNRSERAPSELVIFTGNPDTVRGLIARNNKKIKEVSSNYSSIKQTFIGFLAGMNPTVITESAKNNLPTVISQVIEPALINAGQDCMTSDFYLLNQKIAGEFILQLNRKLTSTPLVTNKDYTMGVSPLLYMKDFTKLKQYREKYEEFLINRNARLDVENKIVEPHIFKFPISMFTEVEIQEHFAPFFSFFTYSDMNDVQKVLLNADVQKKTMYATVLGQAEIDSEMGSVRQMFRQYGYNVLVNDTIFGDIESNLPFGGVGTDTSLIVNVSGGRNQEFAVKWAHRPTTIINEMYLAYGDPNSITPTALRSNADYLSTLKNLLGQKDLSEVPAKTLSQKKEQIYKLANQFGVTIALNQVGPKTKVEQEQKEFLYGVPLQYLAVNSRVNKKDVKKLVLVRTSVTDGSQLLSKISGQYVPQNQDNVLLAKLAQNKNTDYIVAQAIWPGFMPLTESLSDLVSSENINASSDQVIKSKNDLIAKTDFGTKKNLFSFFKNGRAEIQSDIVQMFNQSEAMSEHQINVIMLKTAGFVAEVFKATRTYFPNGAYYKNFGEFATGDTGTVITSHQSSPRQVSSEFVLRLLAARKKWLSTNSANDKLSISDLKSNPDINKFVLENNWETNTKFIWALLTNYESIMVQKAEQIATTELGYN